MLVFRNNSSVLINETRYDLVSQLRDSKYSYFVQCCIGWGKILASGAGMR
jgi:hypothetical protein